MIRRLKHKGLKQFYQRDDESGVRPDMLARVKDILARLGAYFMPMKNPPYPGRNIRDACLEPLGLSITEGAKILGVTRPALSRVINGKAAISPEMAVRLAKAFGGRAETWLKLQLAYDLAQVERKADHIHVQRAQALV